MKRITSILAVLGLLFAGLFFAAPAQASNPNVTICHANQGVKSYNVITLAKEAVFERGHDQHQDKRDIIPSFTYKIGQVRHTYPGLNTTKDEGNFVPAVDCPSVPDQEDLTAQPNPPVYNPPACLTVPVGTTKEDDAFYGSVTVPTDLGTGVATASAPVLSADKSTWTVTYSLVGETELLKYTWPTGEDGTYSFETTALSADPLYITDAETGVSACELSDTGSGTVGIVAAGGALLLGLGAAALIASNRRKEEI